VPCYTWAVSHCGLLLDARTLMGGKIRRAFADYSQAVEITGSGQPTAPNTTRRKARSCLTDCDCMSYNYFYFTTG